MEKVQIGSFVFTEEQYVSDILNYIDHGDPQVRGATAILCGTLIYSILSRSRLRVGDWLGTIRTLTGNGQSALVCFLDIVPGSYLYRDISAHSSGLLGNTFSLVDCIPLLQKTLKDESSVTCKLACTAVRVSIMFYINCSLV